MDALRGSRGDDKIPRRLEDPRGTEGLPESDIEFASWRPAPRQPRHDHSVSHPPLSAQMRVCRTATAPLSCPARALRIFHRKYRGVPVTLRQLR